MKTVTVYSKTALGSWTLVQMGAWLDLIAEHDILPGRFFEIKSIKNILMSQIFLELRRERGLFGISVMDDQFVPLIVGRDVIRSGTQACVVTCSQAKCQASKETTSCSGKGSPGCWFWGLEEDAKSGNRGSSKVDSMSVELTNSHLQGNKLTWRELPKVTSLPSM